MNIFSFVEHCSITRVYIISYWYRTLYWAISTSLISISWYGLQLLVAESDRSASRNDCARALMDGIHWPARMYRQFNFSLYLLRVCVFKHFTHVPYYMK